MIGPRTLLAIIAVAGLMGAIIDHPIWAIPGLLAIITWLFLKFWEPEIIRLVENQYEKHTSKNDATTMGTRKTHNQ